MSKSTESSKCNITESQRNPQSFIVSTVLKISGAFAQDIERFLVSGYQKQLMEKIIEVSIGYLLDCPSLSGILIARSG